MINFKRNNCGQIYIVNHRFERLHARLWILISLLLLGISNAVSGEVFFKVVDLGISIPASEVASEYRIDNWHPSAFSCAMNNKGQIVAYDPFAKCSFLIDPNNMGKRLPLGGVSGFDYACATSINELGEIVGYAFEGSNGGIKPPKACAFVFDPNGSGKNKSLGIKSDEWSSYCASHHRSVFS